MAGVSKSCGESELTTAFALGILPADEAALAEAHAKDCFDCGRELVCLGALAERFAAWPTDILRPPQSLRHRFSERLAGASVSPAAAEWSEPDWEQVAPGIECKLLATDEERHRVSMLVRLERGASYPPHTHAGPEELHLLHGELWIDERKLVPGDYNFGAPGDGDDRVWSETGCTCVLITSIKDILR
jgi:hypothetical protein